MNPFEFVIAIVAIVLVYKVISRWIQQKETQRTLAVPDGSADLARQIAELEERVRVLERIVTDDRYELKRQFEDLGS